QRARRQVPEPQDAVASRRGQAAAVGAESQTRDGRFLLREKASCSPSRAPGPTDLRVEEADQAGVVHAGKPRVGWLRRNRPNHTLACPRSETELASLQTPATNRAVAARRGKEHFRQPGRRVSKGQGRDAVLVTAEDAHF